MTPTIPSPISQAGAAIGELLPCPFCGASAGKPENIRPGKTPLWQISCAVFCSQIRRGTKGEVVRDWNRRSTAHTTGSAPVADGWALSVSESDGRVWLRIKHPRGAECSLSAAATIDEGRGRTIAAQVLDELGKACASPVRTRHHD